MINQIIEKPVLSIENINIQFGNFKAVKNVSTEIKNNEIRFFIGPNGAGKTTVLDAICGKTKVTDGKIQYWGNKRLELTKMRDYSIASSGVGRKFQAPSIFGGITVAENIELAVIEQRSVMATLFKKISKEQKDYVDYVLSFIGLADKRHYFPGGLSHGQKQWLEIGMLMASKPNLLLLDEPVAGMGRRETEQTAALLLKLKSECSIIVVEHDMQFARDVSDSVSVFHEGQIIDEGTMKNVQNNQQVIDVYLGRGGE